VNGWKPKLTQIKIEDFVLLDFNKRDELSDRIKYEPIPLSPEILEKAGFVKDISSQYGGYLISIGEGEMIRIIDDESIGWHYPLNGYKRPITNYLHQLQNLFFALCGEELNITL
jgi:hypothetical protein